MLTLARIVVSVLGAALVAATLRSATRTLVLAPPGALWSSVRMPPSKLPPLFYLKSTVRGTRAASR